MFPLQIRVLPIPGVFRKIGFGLALVPFLATARDDGSAHRFTPNAALGWDGFELLTVGDSISDIADSGYAGTMTASNFDGLGTHKIGNTLHVYLNHETTPGAISRIDLDLTALGSSVNSVQSGGSVTTPILTGVGWAYDRIHSYNAGTGTFTAHTDVTTYAANNFARFCSGTSYLPGSMGGGRGFVDSLYITGEEVGGGLMYALDSATSDLWEIPFLKAGGGKETGSWENAALVDTGNTSHVALLLSDDVGGSPGAPLRLYVGEKDTSSGAGFLARNGLEGGTIYYLERTDGGSATDLPDHDQGTVTGRWTSDPNATNILWETKWEDVHTNPSNPTQAVIADQTDGVYTVTLDLSFSAGNFDPVASSVTMAQIDDTNEPSPADPGNIGTAPDNVFWDENGLIVYQEDGGNQGINRVMMAGLTATGIEEIATTDSEGSGIIDISGLVGASTGEVYLTSIQGSPSQLAVLVAPEPGSGLLLILAAAGLVTRRKRAGQTTAALS